MSEAFRRRCSLCGALGGERPCKPFRDQSRLAAALSQENVEEMLKESDLKIEVVLEALQQLHRHANRRAATFNRDLIVF